MGLTKPSLRRQDVALTSVALAGIGCTVIAAIGAWLLVNPDVLATMLRSLL